jgi:hypothetical protein
VSNQKSANQSSFGSMKPKINSVATVIDIDVGGGDDYRHRRRR